jgi:hypothetical protein
VLWAAKFQIVGYSRLQQYLVVELKRTGNGESQHSDPSKKDMLRRKVREGLIEIRGLQFRTIRRVLCILLT